MTATAGRKPRRVHGPFGLHLPRNPLRVNSLGEHDGRRSLQHRAQVGRPEISENFLPLAAVAVGEDD